MKVQYPDGRTLEMSGNQYETAGPWSFMIWVNTGQASFRMHAAALGSLEMAVKHSGRSAVTTTREASQGRNRLVSLEDAEHAGTSLIWQGDFHEVSTFVHGVQVPLDTITSMLAPLELVDSQAGIVVRPWRGSAVNVQYTLAANMIPGVCSVTVKPLEIDAWQVPSSSGRAIPGGRLWRNDEHDADGKVTRRTAVIVNSTTSAHLVAFNPDSAELATLVNSVQFTLS